VDPDLGTPTTLKWNYPPGAPTPDPALLTGVADQLTWGYPPGVPTPGKQKGWKRKIILAPRFSNVVRETASSSPICTPCPKHRNNNTPFPDPILLEGGADDGAELELVWGYPPGVPTPDPALLMSGGDEPGGWG
jgi:hypothetical protein